MSCYTDHLRREVTITAALLQPLLVRDNMEEEVSIKIAMLFRVETERGS